MTYAPGPQPGMYAPVPTARPPRRRTRGATVLIVIGAAVLAVALAAGVAAAFAFVRVLPTGIVSSDGTPGSAALASAQVPDDATFDAVGGTRYTVWSVAAPGTPSFFRDDVAVECAGAAVVVSAPDVHSTASTDGHEVDSAADFTAPGDGSCTVSVDATRGQLVVTEGQSFADFFGGTFAVVGLIFVAVGGGVVGLGLLVGGIVWKVVARSR